MCRFVVAVTILVAGVIASVCFNIYMNSIEVSLLSVLKFRGIWTIVRISNFLSHAALMVAFVYGQTQNFFKKIYNVVLLCTHNLCCLIKNNT